MTNEIEVEPRLLPLPEVDVGNILVIGGRALARLDDVGIVSLEVELWYRPGMGLSVAGAGVEEMKADEDEDDGSLYGFWDWAW